MSWRRWEGGSGCRRTGGGILVAGGEIWDRSEEWGEMESCGSDWRRSGVSWSAGPVALTAGFSALIHVLLSVGRKYEAK